MGKGNSPSPKADYSAALQSANTPSPIQSQLQTMASNDLSQLGKGDYTNLPKDVLWNFADPAQRARQRELSYNQKGQGVFGLGNQAANPTALGLAKQNIAAHDAQDDATAYEGGVKDAANRAFMTAGDLANMDQARKLGILNVTSGPYQSQINKPGWFDKILSGFNTGSNAAAAAAGGG